MSTFDFTSPASFTIAYGNVTVGTIAPAGFSLHFQITPPGTSEYIQIFTVNITGLGAAAYAVNPSIIGDTLADSTLNGTLQFTPPSVGAFSASMSVTGKVFILDPRTGNFIFNGNQTTTHSLTISGTGIPAMGGGGGVGEAPGVLQSFRRELVPVNSQSAGIVLAYFDETNFNDTIDPRVYIFRAEDIIADRVPTVRRVIITYVDLGVATVMATINGVDDTGVLVRASSTVVLGTVGATGLLMTAFFDMGISCFRPQLMLSQNANGGPFQLSTAMITGTIEKDVTL